MQHHFNMKNCQFFSPESMMDFLWARLRDRDSDDANDQSLKNQFLMISKVQFSLKLQRLFSNGFQVY